MINPKPGQAEVFQTYTNQCHRQGVLMKGVIQSLNYSHSIYSEIFELQRALSFREIPANLHYKEDNCLDLRDILGGGCCTLMLC